MRESPIQSLCNIHADKLTYAHNVGWSTLLTHETPSVCKSQTVGSLTVCVLLCYQQIMETLVGFAINNEHHRDQPLARTFANARLGTGAPSPCNADSASLSLREMVTE